jgi:hypothetical protein
MSVHDRLIEIEVPSLRGPFYAGDWVPLLLVIRRPDTAAAPARIRNFFTRDLQVQLDLDLLNRETEIRPGEVYRLTVPVRVPVSRSLSLDCIGLEVQDEHDQQSGEVFLPAKILEFRPAIGKEITVRLEPICAYEAGTKVQLALRHDGTTTFESLTVTINPEEAVRTGKPTLQRPSFRPGDSEQVELVVDQPEIEVVMVGSVDGQRPEARQVLAVTSPPTPRERRFRFLEPHRLSTDQVTVFEKLGDDPRPVTPVHGTYALRGGCQYQVVIRPLQGAVSRIRLRDIQGRVQVRDTEEDGKAGAWRFLIEVAATAELFRRPEVLYYDVERDGERLTGEIATCLQPPRWAHGRVAIALGLALTVQGLAAIGHFLQRIEFDVTEALADFRPREDFHLFFLCSIPAFWGILKVGDWLQYRLRD